MSLELFKLPDVLVITRAFFEPQLIAIGLGKEQIEQQIEKELEQSLEVVNEAIKNPNAFGLLRLELAVESGKLTFMVTKAASESHIEVNALPLLLERKRRIVDRLRIIRGYETIEHLQNLALNEADPAGQEKLKRQREELEAEIQMLQKQAQSQSQEELKARKEWATLSVELFERRSKVWQSFLARESVATTVGGLLLILITIALLIAMFLNVQIPALVNNAFLVILGYFFGQATGKVLSKAEDKGSEK